MAYGLCGVACQPQSFVFFLPVPTFWIAYPLEISIALVVFDYHPAPYAQSPYGIFCNKQKVNNRRFFSKYLRPKAPSVGFIKNTNGPFF